MSSPSPTLYRTASGWFVQTNGVLRRVPESADASLTLREDLSTYLAENAAAMEAVPEGALSATLPPIERQEIWAAGVTYSRSRAARMAESQNASGGDFYDLVYDAERPEIFFKSTAARVVGPDQKVRIRGDATWNVPEPELAVLISPQGKILGYTVGNDMSSRDIEGANPLYLPQAKIYDGACAIGPGILVTSELLPPSTRIRLEIRRDGKTEYAGATSLSEMKRDIPTLISYLYRETSFPDGSLLLTGTGVIPPDDFTLHHGDEILISVEGVGTLRNWVE